MATISNVAMEGFIFIVIIGVIALIAISNAHSQKKRREAFAEQASSLGLEFDPNDGESAIRAVADGFRLFKRGRVSVLAIS